MTLGDPTGIGPEVVVRALAGLRTRRPEPRPEPRPELLLVVHGHAEVLERARDLCRATLPPLELREPPTSSPFDAPGPAQLAALEQAVAAALSGEVDGLVTAPIQKETIRQAGCDFPGHTDLLAHRTGAEVAMLFASPRLKVALATIHLPLAQVSRTLTAGRLTSVLGLTARSLVRDFGLDAPRIAVAGLNPHAGEGGLLGAEEGDVMRPALAEALPRLQRELDGGLRVEGPLPADAVFRQAVDGRYDAVVAAYHDQALIPMKLVAFHEAVNVTLGLPFVRTSPAHGTAHDIAWTGQADARSTAAALDLALDLARRRAPPTGG